MIACQSQFWNKFEQEIKLVIDFFFRYLYFFPAKD